MPQSLHEPKHPKQDFQVERIAFFSDAVFAIALTLLIIEFKPPHITNTTTYNELMQQLGELGYNAIALLVSFAIIISFWMRHHALFKHIHNYNKPIIVTNMMLLLPIILFPFTTAFLYNSITSTNPLIIIPMRLFFLITAVTSAILYVLYYLVIKKYPECSYPMDEKENNEFNVELLLMTIVFVSIVLLSFISSKIMYLGIIPFAIYHFINMMKKRSKKKKTVAIHKHKK